MGLRAGLDRCGKYRPPPTGIRSPDRSPRSQSLYRLRYPAHIFLGGGGDKKSHSLQPYYIIDFLNLTSTCCWAETSSSLYLVIYNPYIQITIIF